MEFDTSKFTEGFKKAIGFMLNGKHSKKIKDDLQFFKDNKNRLQKDQDSLDALRLIIILIKTNSWRLKEPANFGSQMDSFFEKYGKNFRSSEAKKELIELVGERRKENVEELLTNYSTIEQFTKKLYDLARQGKTAVLGEKGRDNYLRDFGYWDRIPMDRHEMRFIIRTGIYHACSVKNQSDHLEKGHLHNALTRFCAQHLRGYEVEEIDLGEAPGIVDIFIWSYSAEDRYNICGSTPKCEECSLRDSCLYVLTNAK